jgi:hypothetical protein
MKSHLSESVLPANPRFHLRQHDGLYRPIAFLFVTERMAREIEGERRVIRDALVGPIRARQERLFARYDPQVSVRAFDHLLRLFGVPGAPDARVACP